MQSCDWSATETVSGINTNSLRDKEKSRLLEQEIINSSPKFYQNVLGHLNSLCTNIHSR